MTAATAPAPVPPARCLFLFDPCGAERCAVCGGEMSHIVADGCPRRAPVAPSIVWTLRIMVVTVVVAAGVAGWWWLW